MRTLRRAALAAALSLAGGAQAADMAAAKAIYDKVCVACHKADGSTATPDTPKVFGQHPDFLAKALRDYKSGQRKNPIMKGFAEPLTRKDIENLAAYFAAQPVAFADKM
jgi:cytochrome c553